MLKKSGKSLLKFIENTTTNFRILFNDTPMEEVPFGDRKVFMNRDFVVKVDHNPKTSRKTTQTAREIDRWEDFEEFDKQFFAQVLDYGRTEKGKYWLLQERYYPDEENIDESLGDLVETLEFKYQINDLWGYGCNWFQVNGELIIFDWGM